MKLETFFSYPPRYHYRRVIPSDPTIKDFTSIKDVQAHVQKFCDALHLATYVVFQVEPLDYELGDPEFVYLHGDILKQTLAHFRITPDAPANEPPVG